MEVTGTSDAHRLARKLRRELTKPERLLWWALKGDKTGFHWRRQHAAGPYVLDFYCDRARLCVEVDGSSHDFTVEHASARDCYLERWGILTVRVPAAEVLTNLQRGCRSDHRDRSGETPPSALTRCHLPQGGGAAMPQH